jgi:HAMP domain-containing protein
MDARKSRVVGLVMAASRYLRRAGRRLLGAFRRRLSFRLLLVLVVISLVSTLTSSYLILTLQRDQLKQAAEVSASRLNDAIEAGIAHAMTDHDWSLVTQIAQSLASDGGVQRMRLLSTDGTIRVSSLPSETGQQVDIKSQECAFCHAGPERPESQTAIVTLDSGRTTMLSARVIRNQPSCTTCHDPSTETLGLLITETPLTALDQQLSSSIWRLAVPELAGFLLLVGLMIVLLRGMLVRPVAVLSEAVTEVGAGNLDYELPAEGTDELSHLGKAFNDMRKQLQASRAQMDRRNQELAILNAVAVAASEMLDLQNILDLAVDTVVDKLGMHAGLIFLYDPEQGRYVCRATRGATAEQCAEIERRRRESAYDIPRQVANSGKTLFLPRISMDSRFPASVRRAARRPASQDPVSGRDADFCFAGPEPDPPGGGRRRSGTHPSRHGHGGPRRRRRAAHRVAVYRRWR